MRLLLRRQVTQTEGGVGQVYREHRDSVPRAKDPIRRKYTSIKHSGSKEFPEKYASGKGYLNVCDRAGWLLCCMLLGCCHNLHLDGQCRSLKSYVLETRLF